MRVLVVEDDDRLARAAIALAIVTVAAVALGWAVAGRILRPLSTITTATRRILGQ